MPTVAANFTMNPKSLLLLFGAMTLSFAIILAIMLAAIDKDGLAAKQPQLHERMLLVGVGEDSTAYDAADGKDLNGYDIRYHSERSVV